MLDSTQIRQDFPILSISLTQTQTGIRNPLVYLDNAATTQKPTQVIDAIVRYYREQNANVHRSLHTLGEIATCQYENARKSAARFIGASSPKEIVFTRGTTEAINLVARSWAKHFLRPGQTIVVTEMEHHSNLIPWQILAQEMRLKMRFLPFDGNGMLNLATLDDLLENAGIISVTHASNVFGTIQPVEEIIQKAHARGVPVLLDAAQSVPHIPVDVRALDCDFLAFSGHKMCGPTGIGVLYGKEKWLEKMHPYQAGGEMIESVWLDHATYNQIPYRFEAGTPNIEGAIGLSAAIAYLTGLGMNAISQSVEKITRYAFSRISTIRGIRFAGKTSCKTGIISFYWLNIHAHDVAQFLDAKGVAIRAGHHCAQPIMRKLGIPATARVSLYFYNTMEEADKLAEALIQMIEFFQSTI